MRRIALDIETTGLDPHKGHKIIEIGCVELENNFPTGKIWQRYINPNRSMPQEAYEIHGLTEEFLSEKPFFAEVASEFIAFVKTISGSTSTGGLPHAHRVLSTVSE